MGSRLFLSPPNLAANEKDPSGEIVVAEEKNKFEQPEGSGVFRGAHRRTRGSPWGERFRGECEGRRLDVGS